MEINYREYINFGNFFYFLHNNGMLSVLIRIALMIVNIQLSTHNI